MAVGGVGIVASRINLADCDAAERRARVDLAAAHRLAVHYGYLEGIDNHFTLLLPGHADRPDVQCVLHTHMPYATALSMLEDPALLMASQNAIGFDGLVALCDYAGFALDSSEGARMARALGNKTVLLLLRNHGVVTTGTSVADAFNTLYFFERAAMTQILAQSSGLAVRCVPGPVLQHAVEQYTAAAKVEGLDRIELHFAALKRMLDRREPDYAD